MENKSCNCNADNKIVIACSGAADVGLLSDQVARSLSKSGKYKMSCMALFAACNESKIEEFKTKDVLVIDGCGIDCGKKIMEKRGITNYEYFRLTDKGFIKGKTSVNSDSIKKVVTQVM